MRYVIVGLVLALGMSACGSSSSKPEPKTLVVEGVVHVDDLMTVRAEVDENDHPTGNCSTSALQGKKIVISDSKGERIGLTSVATDGKEDPLPASAADDYYGGAPGTCNLEFSLRVPKRTGVYSAQIEGLNASGSFTSGNANKVVIELKP